MYSSPHRAHQALDVPTEVGLTAWPVLEGDTIFLAPSQQRRGVELFAVVDVDQARQSCHGPVEVL